MNVTDKEYTAKLDVILEVLKEQGFTSAIVIVGETEDLPDSYGFRGYGHKLLQFALVRQVADGLSGRYLDEMAQEDGRFPMLELEKDDE